MAQQSVRYLLVLSLTVDGFYGEDIVTKKIMSYAFKAKWMPKEGMTVECHMLDDTIDRIRAMSTTWQIQ